MMMHTTIRSLVTFALVLYAAGLVAQDPFDGLSGENLGLVRCITEHADFMFETTTKPVPVSVSIMEKLFDRPRLAAAMWRHCQFSPNLFAFEHSGGALTVDDSKGLRGTMTLVHKKPGRRIYFIEGTVERGRMGNPMAVSARMVVVYSYWETQKGFTTRLQTWTKLDSALLAVISKPFRGYVRRRQQEFIVYINGNIAKGGLFAQTNPLEFKLPIQREGDAVAIRQYGEVFGVVGKVEQ
jgi:hypothetical protein